MALDHQSYAAWKSWDAQTFGQSTPKEQRKFQIELRPLRLPKGARILEIGFGNGSFLSWARGHGFAVTGLEMNPILVEHAKSHGFEVVQSENIENLGMNKYDAVVAFDVLEHLTPGQIESCLHAVEKALVSGGYFLARFPNGDSPLGLAHQNGDVTHQTTIGFHKWIYWVKKTHLDLVSIKGQAKPIVSSNPFATSVRFIFRMIQLMAQWAYKRLFLPHYKTDYFSANIVSILKKN